MTRVSKTDGRLGRRPFLMAPDRLAIAAFLVILAAPSLVQLAAEAVRGQRPAALQLFTRRPTPENLRAFEKSLQDSSVTVRALRPLMQAAQWFLLRDAGEKAIAGCEGWLFYRPGIDATTRRPRSTDSTAAEAVAAIVRMRDDLAARGIHLLVMPAPNKESVYLDQLWCFASPPDQPPDPETRAFLALCQEAGVEVVDLFTLDRRARLTSPDPLYLEQDSHWSPAGMEIAAAAVADRIHQRGWLDPSPGPYDARSEPIEALGDLLRMVRSPLLESRVRPESIATRQIVHRDTGAPFTGAPEPEVLVLGDSFLRIYERDAPGSAGFVAHLARLLGHPTAGLISDGGASTLVRQDLFRRPRLLHHARVVVWEFVERDIRLGLEGWQTVPLPPREPPQNRETTDAR